MPVQPNALLYGDNLEVLRGYVADASVDLVYLDPPFKSDQGYNVLFKAHDGHRAAAQIQAFDDTWRWDEAASAAFHEVVESGGKISEALQAFRLFLGDTDMLAYLSMMAPRLAELNRTLRQTGSLYLHCDPTASHYLKLLLDAVFGPQNFLSEVSWKRTGTHSSANRWGPVHDVLLVYAKDAGAHKWNRPYVPHNEEHLRRHYRLIDDQGRKYEHGELTGPGVRRGRSGEPWRGFDVTKLGRHWITTVDKLDQLFREGRIHVPPDGGWPRLIRYEDESRGRAIGDVWDDIPPLNMKARERLGYPTQKPVALLERIIEASSDAGDVVLDPFCGCGTTVDAAQKLGRQWIGIDITHLAISLIKKRLNDAYGDAVQYSVYGEPTTAEDAAALAGSDPYQFQWWALHLVNAAPTVQKKGADKGIDGRLYFHDEKDSGKTKLVVFSVKAGHTNVAHLRDLRGVVDRERAAIGVLITMEEPTKPMRSEAASAGYYQSAGWHTRHPRLQLLTVAELLAGAKVDMPPVRQTNVTFRRAPKAATQVTGTIELFGAVAEPTPPPQAKPAGLARSRKSRKGKGK